MAGNLTAMIAAAFSGGAAPPVTSDPYYEYTTLLLPGNGTNGAQNNTFLDGSTNNFTITRNGNTTQGTFSPFSQTGWGNYFGSSTSYLKFATDAGFAIGAGNFSIECFVNLTAWSGNQRVCIQGQSGTTNIQIAKDSVSNDLFVDIQGTRVITYAWTPSVGQWYHIALVRSGTGTNQVTLYIDGSSVATGTSSASIAQNQLFIGGIDWASSYNIQGYISNFRYSNVARTITVPTSPYTSDANTLILTCQSNRFVDNSASPKTITVNGTTSVVAFSPFNPSASWSAATYGGSGYFDGSGDYLSVASNTAFDFGTGDFTIELWINLSAAANYGGVLTKGNVGAISSATWAIDFNNTGTALNFYVGAIGSGAYIITTTTNVRTLNAWTHVAVSRISGSTKMFINGVQEGSTYSTSYNVTSGGDLYVGTGFYTPSTNFVTGYISNVRILKGTGLYSSAFTPPTAPLTAITNTSLLLNFTNAGIYDATSKNDLETVGNAQISTTQSKWGGSSIYLDGNGDYLTSPSNNLVSLGTADFTVEFWVNYASAIAYSTVIISTWFIEFSNTRGLVFYDGATGYTRAYTVATSQWYHVAVSKQGTNLRFFIDGVQQGATVTSYTYNITNASTLEVGRGQGGLYPVNGYIQDLRITKGYARYTANFTPPTAAFPTL